jgi:nucleotide-binding universal stress UspA family protein
VFPFLSLEDIDLDVDLARSLPRRLAYYHLALPIAQDADGITIAMAHPENPNVVRVVEAALEANVIPVQSFAETIREQLDRIWQVQAPDGALRVLSWARTAAALDQSAPYIDGLMTALGRTGAEQVVIERVASETFTGEGTAELVIASIASDDVPESLFRTQASLLILRDALQPPRAILHVLRGHNPDYRVFDWLVPVARHNTAEVTLLMGVDGSGRRPLVSELSVILMAQDKRHAHIAECRRTLAEAGITGRLKIRQEMLLSAVEHQLAEQRYDLVAMAAEAYGDFAHQIWKIVRAQTPAVLIIKP